MKECCENCKFLYSTFVNHGSANLCRRYPPIYTTIPAYVFGFPYVKDGDWCGEWKAKEM